jgi:hypothetical protein
MNMPVPVSVTRVATASPLIAHDAQDARKIRLQHINNNNPGATAKHSQTPCPGSQAPQRPAATRRLSNALGTNWEPSRNDHGWAIPKWGQQSVKGVCPSG